MSELKNLVREYKKHSDDLTKFLINNGAANIEDYRSVSAQIMLLNRVISDIELAIRKADAEDLGDEV